MVERSDVIYKENRYSVFFFIIEKLIYLNSIPPSGRFFTVLQGYLIRFNF